MPYPSRTKIPAVLGADLALSKGYHSFALPAIRSYAAWNPGNRIDGVKVPIKGEVQNLQSFIRQSREDLLG